jgi:hypothetical protein
MLQDMRQALTAPAVLRLLTVHRPYEPSCYGALKDAELSEWASAYAAAGASHVPSGGH